MQLVGLLLHRVQIGELLAQLQLHLRVPLARGLQLALALRDLRADGHVRGVLGRQLVRALLKRVAHHVHLILQLVLAERLLGVGPPKLSEAAVSHLDAPARLFVVQLLLLQKLGALVQERLLLADLHLLVGEGFAGPLDGGVAALHRLHRVLPLQHQVLPLDMKRAEVLGGLVELDLRGLRLGHLHLELVLLAIHLLGELLDVEIQLLHARLVRALVLLKR
mmetsp:Transcript_16631/g.28049  ORF Transcript_16631/g.28049 Transcript_16631/m.28049 type:complete len:221 (+) Transcript_16631:2157-2819(+)